LKGQGKHCFKRAELKAFVDNLLLAHSNCFNIEGVIGILVSIEGLDLATPINNFLII